MSEFSESYHLRTSDPQQVAALLERAKLDGYTFEPSNGWTSLVAEGDPYCPNTELISVNQGVLLHYVHAEDHGWAFELYDRDRQVAAYECSWEDELEIKNEVDLSALQRLLPEVFTNEVVLQLRSILNPNSMEDVFAGPFPAHRFAQALGIEHHSWTSYAYSTQDDEG